MIAATAAGDNSPSYGAYPFFLPKTGTHPATCRTHLLDFRCKLLNDENFFVFSHKIAQPLLIDRVGTDLHE